jgi:hypothetical protein
VVTLKLIDLDEGFDPKGTTTFGTVDGSPVVDQHTGIFAGMYLRCQKRRVSFTGLEHPRSKNFVLDNHLLCSIKWPTSNFLYLASVGRYDANKGMYGLRSAFNNYLGELFFWSPEEFGILVGVFGFSFFFELFFFLIFF